MSVAPTAGPQPVARAAQHAHQHDVERHGDRERLADRDVAHVHRVRCRRPRRAIPAERAKATSLYRKVGTPSTSAHVLVVVDGEQAEAQARATNRVGGADRGERPGPDPADRACPSARPASAGHAARRSGRRPGPPSMRVLRTIVPEHERDWPASAGRRAHRAVASPGTPPRRCPLAERRGASDGGEQRPQEWDV